MLKTKNQKSLISLIWHILKKKGKLIIGIFKSEYIKLFFCLGIPDKPAIRDVLVQDDAALKVNWDPVSYMSDDKSWYEVGYRPTGETGNYKVHHDRVLFFGNELEIFYFIGI